MADARTTPVLPVSGEFVYVPVPTRDYAAVVQFLVDRVLTRRGPSAPASWDPAAVHRLHAEVAGLPLAGVVDVLAEASPGYVAFDDLAERSGLGTARLRAQLASLTKLATRHGQPSPVRTRAARDGAPTAYQLPPEVASAWAGSTSR